MKLDSQADGSVLMVPCRDCVPKGTQRVEAGFFQSTAHAETLVRF